MTEPGDPIKSGAEEDGQEDWIDKIRSIAKYIEDELTEWDPNSMSTTNNLHAENIDSNLKIMHSHGAHCKSEYNETLRALREFVGRIPEFKERAVDSYYQRFPILDPTTPLPEEEA